MKEDANNVYPPAVLRALFILDFIAANTAPISIKEISDKLEIPHASAYRIVKCLTDYGYMRESPLQNDKYMLGYKLAILSKMAFDGTDLITAAIPHLRDLALKTSQACQLCVLDDGYVLTLDQALPHSAITIIAKLGEPIPINASASGKVMISLFPENKRKDILSKVWHSYKQNTENTVMDLQAFLQILEGISKQNYATDFEEFSPGIGCLAVPVFDYSNNAIAAIGLTGPIDNYKNADVFNFMLNSLLNTSKDISKELYHSI